MGAIGHFHDMWVRKFARNVQDHGVLTALRKTVAFLIKPIYETRVYRLYRVDFQCDRTDLPAEIEGVDFRFITASDSDAIQQIESQSEWLDGTVQKRLKEGVVCIAAFEGGQLAGFNLVSFGEVYMPLVNLRRRFRTNEAWSEQIATVKTFRKKGLASNLRYHMFQELRKRGIRRFYGGALIDNIPSLKLAQRVGFHEFVDIRYRRILTSSKRYYRRVQQ
jgi:GNAT superfamily N-acetyltransferase